MISCYQFNYKPGYKLCCAFTHKETFLHNEYCCLQDPVDGHDECDVIWRQAHRCQYDHHGN